MDLTNEELKRRYFRKSNREDGGLKSKFANKFGSFFVNNKRGEERRKSYLDDSSYSLDLDELEENKNTKIKGLFLNDWN